MEFLYYEQFKAYDPIADVAENIERKTDFQSN